MARKPAAAKTEGAAKRPRSTKPKADAPAQGREVPAHGSGGGDAPPASGEAPNALAKPPGVSTADPRMAAAVALHEGREFEPASDDAGGAEDDSEEGDELASAPEFLHGEASAEAPAKRDGTLAQTDAEALQRAVVQAHERHSVVEYRDEHGRDWTVRQSLADGRAVVNIACRHHQFYIAQRDVPQHLLGTVYADIHVHNTLEAVHEQALEEPRQAGARAVRIPPSKGRR